MFRRLKLVLAAVSTLALLTLVVAVFWLQDWQYSLPTPRPPGLLQPPLGTLLQPAILLPAAAPRDRAKPLLLHFFNPGCPCSRFNTGHVQELVRAFGSRVDFLAVLEEDDSDSLMTNFAKAGLMIPAAVDSGGAIAAALGVYSTPQAVLLDERGSLVYRGNYNRTRYCTDGHTEYARLAIQALLDRTPPPRLDPAAVVAYGCPLPKKTGARP